MRFSELTITNYRSFRDTPQKVVFPKVDKPLSIIGHNNSGKTNLVNAILLSTAYSQDWYRLDEYQFHNRVLDKKITIKTRFTESFVIPNIYPGDKSDKHCWGTLFESSFEHGRSNSYIRCIDQEDKLVVKAEKMKERGLPVSFTTYRNKLNIIYVDFHDLDKHFFLSGSGLLAQLFREVKDDFYRDDNVIKDKAGKEHIRKNLFELITDKLKNVLSTELLEEFIGQLSTELNASLNFEDNAVDFEFKLAAARELYSRAYLQVTDAKGKVALPITCLGSGLKAMIAVAMISLLAARDETEKIFIFEEPETYLHELYQDHLYKVLKKLAKTNQVIISTHSKKFVDVFSPETIIKVHNPNFTNSEIIQLKDEVELPNEVHSRLGLDSVEDFSYFMKSLEPNMGLFLFSRKVIIVEGPHDILAYRLALKNIDLSSKNICLIATWGKDTSQYIFKLCKALNIDAYLVHDWDLPDDNIDVSIESVKSSEYSDLSSIDKAQYTKNQAILTVAANNIHWNKRNLESVLKITKKGTVEIAEKLSAKTTSEIAEKYPGFLSHALLEFVEIKT